MRTMSQVLAAGLLGAALMLAPPWLAGSHGGLLGFVAAAAHAAPVDPNPQPKSLGQLLDEGYDCWPVADGVIHCYRDKDSPKYECRPSGCIPIETRRQPGGSTWGVQTRPLDAQTSKVAR